MVFKTNGVELTRQEHCSGIGPLDQGIACPIQGGSFRFIPDSYGEADRIVVEWNSKIPQEPDVYALKSTYRKQAKRKSGSPSD